MGDFQLPQRALQPPPPRAGQGGVWGQGRVLAGRVPAQRVRAPGPPPEPARGAPQPLQRTGAQTTRARRQGTRPSKTVPGATAAPSKCVPPQRGLVRLAAPPPWSQLGACTTPARTQRTKTPAPAAWVLGTGAGRGGSGQLLGRRAAGGAHGTVGPSDPGRLGAARPPVPQPGRAWAQAGPLAAGPCPGSGWAPPHPRQRGVHHS